MTSKSLLKRAAAVILGSVAVMSLPVTAAGAMERGVEREPTRPMTTFDLTNSAPDTAGKTTCTDYVFNGWGDCLDFVEKCKGKVTDLGYDDWFFSWSVSCES